MFVCLLCGFLFLLITGHAAAPAHAETRTALPRQSTSGAAPIDVIVILDDSGSMATCWPWPQGQPPSGPPCDDATLNAPSDPNELRYSAARLLVHLADSADRIAVLRFDSTAEGVGSMSLLQEVGSAENRSRLAASLQSPEEYALRGYTRMDLGLKEALQLLELHGDPNRSQYVLLLTDGEPTAPLQVTGQRQTITNLLAQIEDAGALLYPVILCNPDAGCAGDFLKTSTPLAREAKSSQDLLLIFSELFAEMKSDRSVVTHRNVHGNLTISIRKAHGAGSIAFVSPQSAITAVERDGAPMLTQSLLADGNIDLNLAVAPLAAGEWVAKTTDLSSFAVVQADSYPELLFPPPSVLGNAASARYYPAGKSPLIVVAGAGPAADEPLMLNGNLPISLLGQDPISGRTVAVQQLSGGVEEVAVQLGEDREPLQLRRTFRLQTSEELPKAQVFSPSASNPGILQDGSLQLQVGFGPSVQLEDLQAVVYVTDLDGGEIVYRRRISCGEHVCSDDGFMPQDGRDYEALFLLTAATDGVRFGDYARTLLEVEPAIYVKGLPADIDLAKMPPEGWPLTIQASTVEEIGTLEASLVLRRSDTSEIMREASVSLSVEVPENGIQTALLHVDGLDLLRPGQYEGQLNLSAFSPAGLPMEVQVRPAPSLAVVLDIPRSQARIQVQEADFGALLYDTSPNFRLDEQVLLPVAYSGDTPFRLTVELAESSCSGLTATAGDVQPFEAAGDSAADSAGSDGLQPANWALPVRLQSEGPMSAGGCHGLLSLAGPSQDFDVLAAHASSGADPSSAATVPFRLQIRDVEWGVAGALDFGDLGRAGERATETLFLRFNGKTPFVLKIVGLTASGETGSGVMKLDELFLEAPHVEVSGLPDDEGFFEVPVTLIARKALPKDALRGSFYSGELLLSIVGLAGETRSVDISFRSPTLYQRYVEWWLRPFYTFPLVFCSGPMLLLGLLILVARARTRGYNMGDDEDPGVTLPGQDSPLTPGYAAAPGSPDNWHHAGGPEAAFVTANVAGGSAHASYPPPVPGSEPAAGSPGYSAAFENIGDTPPDRFAGSGSSDSWQGAGAGTQKSAWDAAWDQGGWGPDPYATAASGDFGRTDPPGDNSNWSSPSSGDGAFGDEQNGSRTGAGSADPWDSPRDSV
ncbi:MAG: VWA domain-containing protein [Caldilineaceae bacterium SB0665_bin_25]|nr:VWA domain-containing protein [Caldilineaceae bacterium SB0665_bin_25]